METGGLELPRMKNTSKAHPPSPRRLPCRVPPSPVTFPLSNDDAPKLNPITEAGSGMVQEKEKAFLSEIIERLNTLFGIDTTDGDQLSWPRKPSSPNCSRNRPPPTAKSSLQVHPT